MVANTDMQALGAGHYSKHLREIIHWILTTLWSKYCYYHFPDKGPPGSGAF